MLASNNFGKQQLSSIVALPPPELCTYIKNWHESQQWYRMASSSHIFMACLCSFFNHSTGTPSDVSLSYTSYLNPPPSTHSDSLPNGEYSITPLGDGGAEILHRDVVDGLPYVVKSVEGGSGGDGSGEGYCIIETSSEASTTDMQGEGKELAATEQAVGGEHKAVFPSGPPQVRCSAVCIG